MHLELLKSRAVMSEEGSCQQSKAEDTLCLFWLKSKAEDTESRHKHREAAPCLFFVIPNQLGIGNMQFGSTCMC